MAKHAVIMAVLSLGLGGSWFMMIHMPGESYRGPLPPATHDIRQLEQELHTYVDTLAGKIGERNLFRYPQLVEAANYIDTTLSQFRVSGPPTTLSRWEASLRKP